MTQGQTGEVVIEGLQKRYHSVVAIRDVSLRAAPGQFVTLLGPSGSGKTTTLMAIAGFLQPDAGRIMLDGRDITRLPPNRRDLGMVFQHYALFPNMTVAQNVGYPLKVRGRPAAEIAERVATALRMVKLDQHDARFPAQLSGGQQQRVALARAIVFSPNVLLMDEPLGALDKNLREHMQSEIRRIHRELGTTVFYVTHDQEEALSMSDIVVVMKDGGIEQIGAPDELYRRPRNAFVAGFIGGANVLEAVVEEVRGGTALLRHASGQSFLASVDAPRGSTVAVAVRPEAIRIDADGTGPDQTGLEGTVIERTYVGAGTRIGVEIGSITMVAAVSPEAALATSPGEKTRLVWNIQSAVPLENDREN